MPGAPTAILRGCLQHLQHGSPDPKPMPGQALRTPCRSDQPMPRSSSRRPRSDVERSPSAHMVPRMSDIASVARGVDLRARPPPGGSARNPLDMHISCPKHMNVQCIDISYCEVLPETTIGLRTSMMVPTLCRKHCYGPANNRSGAWRLAPAPSPCSVGAGNRHRHRHRHQHRQPGPAPALAPDWRQLSSQHQHWHQHSAPAPVPTAVPMQAMKPWIIKQHSSNQRHAWTDTSLH
jgi:hypothetical protein